MHVDEAHHAYDLRTLCGDSHKSMLAFEIVSVNANRIEHFEGRTPAHTLTFTHAQTHSYIHPNTRPSRSAQLVALADEVASRLRAASGPLQCTTSVQQERSRSESSANAYVSTFAWVVLTLLESNDFFSRVDPLCLFFKMQQFCTLGLEYCCDTRCTDLV
jgi:hypothetical protein